MKPNTLDYGTLALRIALGGMFLSHGLLKLFVFTLAGTAAFFTSVGFPAFTAYVVVPAEILAGIALLVGFQVRLVALAGLPILLGTVVVHAGNGWLFSNPKGGWEYPVYLIVTSLAVVLLGGGRLAVTQPKAQPAHESGRTLDEESVTAASFPR
jgi:putative oxidoreductase